MREIKFSNTSYELCKKEWLSFRNANRHFERNEHYFDWRYLGLPAGIKPIVVWAESGEGKKVGGLSIISHCYLVNNRVHSIGILGDISIAREWRGRGIAKKMFDYLSSLPELQKFSGCLVLPNEEAAKPLERANWKVITQLNRYVKVINCEKILSDKLKSKSFGKMASVPINLFLQLFSFESLLREKRAYQGEEIKRFDERFDDLWNSLNKTGGVIGVRNREFLTWRYLNHPVTQYRIFTLSCQGRLAGYIIFHEEGDIGHLDDILSVNENKHPQYLLFYFLKLIRKAKTFSALSVWINPDQFIPIPLRRFGFIKRADYQKVMVKQQGARFEEQLLFSGYKSFFTSGDKDV